MMNQGATRLTEKEIGHLADLVARRPVDPRVSHSGFPLEGGGSAKWDIFLVSTKVTKEIERDRQQKDRPFGCIWKHETMTVWALQWSELISRAKEGMHLVHKHLKNKSRELSVSEYLREQFPDILGELTEAMSS